MYGAWRKSDAVTSGKVNRRGQSVNETLRQSAQEREGRLSSYILAIDQGTTSSRAMLFREDFTVAALAQEEFAQHYPHSGWVEHDPEDIWRTVVSTARGALAKAGADRGEIAGIGITNQRETTVVWDRATGHADPQRHRLAGPAHCRALCAA